MQSERVLLLSGQIDPASGQVTFRPAYVLDTPGGAQLPDPGEYTLELLDANGEVISAYPFAPARATADPLGGETAFEIAGFHLTLPYAEEVASIRVRRGDAILGKLEASTRAPSLEAGVSALDADSRSMRVNWSGHAAEGVSLRYLVRASTDGGATWQTIGVDLSAPSIDLNPNDFGGQSVLVQVLASDGLRTASLRLGPFVVPQATDRLAVRGVWKLLASGSSIKRKNAGRMGDPRLFLQDLRGLSDYATFGSYDRSTRM